MNTQKMPHGIVRSAYGVAEKLEPLKSKKDPVIAAIAGFALGGIGLGLYLKSWTDFLLPSGMLIVLMVLGIPFGELPTFFIPFFWAAYGYRRVKASNAKLENHGGDILDVEIVAPPIQKRQKLTTGR
jgi:hypothetical protein